MRPLARCVLRCVLAAGLAGCAAQRPGSVLTAVGREQLVGPDALSVGMLQSEVMGFADAYASFVFQAADEVMEAAERPQVRREAHKAKLATALGAWTIATNPNPAVSLLDMVVMVKLEHDSYRRVGPQLFGKHAGTLIAAYAKGEEQITELAARALWPGEMEQLEQLVRQWRKDHPDQWMVSHIRFNDFAQYRGITQISARTGGSMFTLVGLDPLAKMDPTLRQVEQSRLLGERMFFFISRMPALLSWQMESLYYRLTSTPEVQRALASTDRFAEIGEQLVARSEALPDEVAERFAVERAAAIDQIQRAVREEGHGLLEDLDARREMLADVRSTLEAGTTLSESLQATTESVSTLAGRIRSEDLAPAPPGERVELEDVRETVAETSVMVRDLNELALTLDRMLASPQLAALDGAMARAESSGRRLMNHAALLIAGLIGLVIAGLILRLYAGHRLVGRRRTPPAGGRGRPVVEIETVARPAEPKRAPLADPPA